MKKTVFLFIAILFSILLYFVSRGGEERSFKRLIDTHKIPLVSQESLDAIIKRASEMKVVLLGEATHGTGEFYSWRDSISRRLINEQDFNFILVEGDWASLFLLNRYVKGVSDFSSAKEVVRQFNRWPSWMWRNEEVATFAEWLRDFNQHRPPDEKVGFYGMDVYDEWLSYDEVMAFLKEYDASLANNIRGFYDCMKLFGRDSWKYAGAVSNGYNACTPYLKTAFDLLEGNLNADDLMSDYDKMYVIQNARVFKNAEKFFRKAVIDQDASWNSRVMHMFVTLQTLLDFYGQDAKAIVWAHNTHIGDARATDMALSGQVNIGQLAREHFNPENVCLVGFGTYEGQVTAGRQWGRDMLQLTLPEAMPESFEGRIKKASAGDFLLIMNPQLRKHPFIVNKIGHRAVGVVYNPEHERLGNYVPSIMGERYDAFLFIEKTRPLIFVD